MPKYTSYDLHSTKITMADAEAKAKANPACEWVDDVLGKYISKRALVDKICTKARNSGLTKDNGDAIQGADLAVYVSRTQSAIAK